MRRFYRSLILNPALALNPCAARNEARSVVFRKWGLAWARDPPGAIVYLQSRKITHGRSQLTQTTAQRNPAPGVNGKVLFSFAEEKLVGEYKRSGRKLERTGVELKPQRSVRLCVLNSEAERGSVASGRFGGVKVFLREGEKGTPAPVPRDEHVRIGGRPVLERCGAAIGTHYGRGLPRWQYLRESAGNRNDYNALCNKANTHKFSPCKALRRV